METPRALLIFPGAIRFLQSRGMALLGVLFILTAFKWGALLFTVHQYETVIITHRNQARFEIEAASFRRRASIR